VTVLTWALWSAPIDWTLGRLLVFGAALVSGSLIFGSLFVMGGAFQIVPPDASEVSNAFTYGGSTLTQYPLAIYPTEVVRAVTFIVPVAFVNWYPALYVLDRRRPVRHARMVPAGVTGRGGAVRGRADPGVAGRPASLPEHRQLRARTSRG
jgi:ABC-2 type transport system permease protein